MLHSLFVHHRYEKHDASHCGCFTQHVLSMPLIYPHARLLFKVVPQPRSAFHCQPFLDVFASSSHVP
jgi:hypothetical protein